MHPKQEREERRKRRGTRNDKNDPQLQDKSRSYYSSHNYGKNGSVSRYPQDQHRRRAHDSRSRRHYSSRYDANGRLVSRSSQRSMSQRSQSQKSTKSERPNRSYSRGSKRSKHRDSHVDHHKTAENMITGTSNKDLPNSTRNQQYHMFGYHRQSSETAGIGAIYDSGQNESALYQDH